MMYMKDGMGVAAPMANEVQTNTDYSHNNVQVEGVDEADIVKTDGTFVYVLSNREKPVVRIIRAQPATSMKVESTIDLSSSGMSPTEIYVEENTLIVVGVESTYGGPIPFMQEKMMAPSIWPGYGFGQKAQVRIYDVSSAANPKLTRTVSLDGSFLESRRIGNKLYLVLQSPFAIWGDPHIMEKSSIVPQMTDSRTGKTTDMAPCNRIAILPRIPSPQYLTVATIPVNDTNAQVKTSVARGHVGRLACSGIRHLRDDRTLFHDVRVSPDGEGTLEHQVELVPDAARFQEAAIERYRAREFGIGSTADIVDAHLRFLSKAVAGPDTGGHHFFLHERNRSAVRRFHADDDQRVLFYVDFRGRHA
jgi:hypothetical protein